MADEQTDMQIRKFLKRVGVESHEAIARALEEAPAGPLAVRVELSIGDGAAPAKVFEGSIGGD